MEYSYEHFKTDFYKLTDIDLNSYKERQMKRRIDSWMSSRGLSDYEPFYNYLKSNNDKLEEFIDYITINVSEFFRNPEQWEYLENEIIPKLAPNLRIRIWSAACSTGDEPYTLAMIFLKHFPKTKFSIIATDIDDKALTGAKEGVYSHKSIVNVPEEYRKYFTKNEKGKYVISDEIKKCVSFKKHNLFKDPYPVSVNLIVCRNVLIYFTEEKKDEIFKEFHKSLVRGGVLFVGNTEQMIDYKTVGFDRNASFFYEKK